MKKKQIIKKYLSNIINYRNIYICVKLDNTKALKVRICIFKYKKTYLE